jgi:hypothetical protein
MMRIREPSTGRRSDAADVTAEETAEEIAVRPGERQKLQQDKWGAGRGTLLPAQLIPSAC